MRGSLASARDDKREALGMTEEKGSGGQSFPCHAERMRGIPFPLCHAERSEASLPGGGEGEIPHFVRDDTFPCHSEVSRAKRWTPRNLMRRSLASARDDTPFLASARDDKRKALGMTPFLVIPRCPERSEGRRGIS